MTSEESVFDGPSNHVRWAASLACALVDRNEPLLARLMEADGDPDAKILGLGALCVILLRMWESGGGPLPKRALGAVDGFMGQGGVDFDLLAFVDLVRDL